MPVSHRKFKNLVDKLKGKLAAQPFFTSTTKNEWSSALFTIFCLILATVIVYVFYASELRVRLENELFDLRTRIKPALADTSRLAIITISQADIVKIDGPLARRPTIHTIESLLESAKESGAESVVLMLPNQDFDYDDDEMRLIVKWVRAHANAYIGLYDYSSREPSELTYPGSLMSLDKRALSAGTLQKFRQGVIRSYPLASYIGTELKSHILLQVALDYSNSEIVAKLKEHNHKQIIAHKNFIQKRVSDQENIDLPHIKLNYFLPHHFLTISAAQLLAKELDLRLQGRIVLIGYTAYRPKSIGKDGTHVNTPWEGELNLEVSGTPLIFVHGIALSNLLNGTWLEDAPIFINILQTFFMTFLSFVVWAISPAFAVVLFLCAFTGLIILHGFLFSYANIFIPLSDTLLFSFFATIGGAFLRAHKDSLLIAEKEHKAKSQRLLAVIQSRFLNRFSLEIDHMNNTIATTLEKHLDKFNNEKNLDKTFHKALSSSYELKEYLAGIKQYTDISENDSYHVKKQKVFVKPLLGKIMSQFEGILEQKPLQINIDIEPNLSLWTDEVLLEPILFNLISNAIKYSNKDGLIIISADCLSKQQTVIKVKDFGPGIPEEYHNKIFEKFYRIKDDRVYKIKGNGLGLFLCRFFAEKLGSKIEVESAVGEGACFKLYVEQLR